MLHFSRALYDFRTSVCHQVRAAQHLLSEKGAILDIPREMSACMADGRYMELVKLYRKAHTTYSSSILSQVHFISTSYR